MEPRISESEQLTMRPKRRMQYGNVQQSTGRPPEAVER
jgi:hypothetical protein